MGTSSYTYYQHIINTPLNKFIDVAVDSNLSALIIKGFPPPNELSEAWTGIVEEYTEAIGDNEQKLSTNLYKQINRLAATIDQVEILVKMLSKYYCGKFVTELNRLLNTNIVFDVTQPVEYDKKLQNCISRSKGFKIKMDLLLMQFEAMQSKEKQGGKVTREYFEGIMITLSDHGKYQLSENITVWQFCERIRRLNKYIAAMEARKK